MQLDLEKIKQITTEVPKDFIFTAISGAHLYGFSSHNSDLDIRGCHWAELPEFQRYSTASDTLDIMWDTHPLYPNEVDIVSHSVLKYLHLMSKGPNGYILEQIHSPLIITTSPAHEELKEISRNMISKEMMFHYGGFYRNQAKLLLEQKKEIKLVLYQLRILNTAIFLARTGELDINLISCNSKSQLYDQAKLIELIELKIQGEKNNFKDPRFKEYWFTQIHKTEPLLRESFEHSDLGHFNPTHIRKLSQDFINSHYTLKYLN
jgi:predicted nucleotidyltransferase